MAKVEVRYGLGGLPHIDHAPGCLVFDGVW
jgi:hypothetical protein